MTALLLIAGGFAALLAGGEFLVRGAVGVARRAGLPPMVIGLTLVGFGTSMPELVTSINAALAGAPGIALGNVVGSNTANILLVLGVAALLAPIAVAPAAFRRDGSALMLATLAGLAAILSGTLGRVEGALGLVGLACFLTLALRSGGAEAEVYAQEADAVRGRPPLRRASAEFAGGLVLVLLGAHWLVSGAVDLATGLGVSEAVIGVTIVAIGTSLPELVTSAVAARRGESDVAFGNVIGSNIFNLMGILGVTALVRPLAVPQEIAAFDVWVMLAATLLMLAVAVTGWRITRREGALMLALYALYLGWLAF